MDRQTPEGINSIKLYIDSLSPKHSHLLLTSLILLLGSIFLLVSHAPPGILTQHKPLTTCLDSVYSGLGYTCSPYDPVNNPVFSIEVHDLGLSNKFLSLRISPFRSEQTNAADMKGQFETSGFIMQGTENLGALFTQQRRDITFDCSSPQEECSSGELATLPRIENRKYYFVVKVLNPQELSPSFQVTVDTMDLSSWYYRFGSKLAFLLVTVAFYFVNTVKMSGLKKAYYCFEQKLLQVMVPLLVVINEPFTAFVFEGTTYVVVLTLIFLVFSSMLMRIWFRTIDHLAGSDSSVMKRSTKFSKLYLLAYFVITLVTYTYYANKTLINPLFDFNSTCDMSFNVIKTVMYITLAVGIAWIGFKTFKIIRGMDYLSERETTFFLFSAFFMLAHFYLVSQGSIYPFTYNTQGLISFCGLSTLYIVSSSYLFFPTKEGISQANYLKKYNNPEVKASYEDLEASVSHPKHPATLEPTSTQSGGNKGNGGYEKQHNSSIEKDMGAQKYPFENKGNEEEL